MVAIQDLFAQARSCVHAVARVKKEFVVRWPARNWGQKLAQVTGYVRQVFVAADYRLSYTLRNTAVSLIILLGKVQFEAVLRPSG